MEQKNVTIFYGKLLSPINNKGFYTAMSIQGTDLIYIDTLTTQRSLKKSIKKAEKSKSFWMKNDGISEVKIEKRSLGSGNKTF